MTTPITEKSNSSNPFLHIPLWLKRGILIYVLLYDFFLPFIAFFESLKQNNYLMGGLLTFVLLKFLLGLIKISPIIFKFKGTGILHPLVLPTLISIAREVVTNPLGLISPFTTSSINLNTTSAAFLYKNELIEVNIESIIVQILCYIFLYIGYYLVNVKRSYKITRLKKIKEQKIKLLALFGLFSIVIFFQIKGGLVSWMSFYGKVGRSEAMSEIGPVIRFLGSFYFINIAWYLLKGKKVLKSPVFIITLLVFLFAGFMITGSRSSILDIIIAFLAAWMIKHNKIPKFSIVFLAFFMYVLFGALGALRESSTYTGGNLDTTVLTDNLSKQIERASEALEDRNKLGADIAIYSHVPEKVDYLYGKSYLSFIFFWLPSSIWPDKPSGAGKYNGELIYNTRAGIPPSPFAEVYWNFGYLGIFLFIFNGIGLSLIAKFFKDNPSHVGVIVVYVLIISSTTFLNSVGLTELFQRLIFVYVWLKIIKIF